MRAHRQERGREGSQTGVPEGGLTDRESKRIRATRANRCILYIINCMYFIYNIILIYLHLKHPPLLLAPLVKMCKKGYEKLA